MSANSALPLRWFERGIAFALLERETRARDRPFIDSSNA
jgi:hypothetical protein